MHKLKEMSKATFSVSWISESTKSGFQIDIHDYNSADSKIPTDHQVVYIMLEELFPPLRIRIIINCLP